MSRQAWRVGVAARGLEPSRYLPRSRPPGPAELLAWDLAEWARPMLDKRTRSALFVTLGAGESGAVIVGVIRAAARKDLEVPSDLVARTAAWLDGYVGAEDECTLRELLGRVSASKTTFPPHRYEETDGRR